MSTPLHPSARRADDEDEDLLTPGQSVPSRAKRPKRESSLNRSIGQQRLVLKTKSEQTPDASPAPPGNSNNNNNNNPGINKFVNEPSTCAKFVPATPAFNAAPDCR